MVEHQIPVYEIPEGCEFKSRLPHINLALFSYEKNRIFLSLPNQALFTSYLDLILILTVGG